MAKQQQPTRPTITAIEDDAAYQRLTANRSKIAARLSDNARRRTEARQRLIDMQRPNSKATTITAAAAEWLSEIPAGVAVASDIESDLATIDRERQALQESSRVVEAEIRKVETSYQQAVHEQFRPRVTAAVRAFDAALAQARTAYLAIRDLANECHGLTSNVGPAGDAMLRIFSPITEVWEHPELEAYSAEIAEKFGADVTAKQYRAERQRVETVHGRREREKAERAAADEKASRAEKKLRAKNSPTAKMLSRFGAMPD